MERWAAGPASDPAGFSSAIDQNFIPTVKKKYRPTAS
jgi:hypothetical protein